MKWEIKEEEYQRLDCYPEENADEEKCKARGCVWRVRGDTNDVNMDLDTLFLYSENPLCFSSYQPSDTVHIPWCFYPEDYGYSVTAAEETNSGITVDITRNMKYKSSGRPDSPDINTLRVEIRYHTSDMLQFKVCIFCVCGSNDTFSWVSGS